MNNEKALDNVGWAILGELQSNARLSLNEIGRRVNLSAPAVADRIEKMETAGIITGYHAAVDAAKVGLPMSAFIQADSAGSSYAKLVEMAQTLPEVAECYRVTGQECLIIKVRVSSIEHLQGVIDRFATLGPVNTSVVLSSVIEWRPLKRNEDATEAS
ncbi:Lrp/AsnC family transcriptional regulator [Rubrobacter aplysinae]|uniref:Lrp/AsnC family transcriptional regulator n=1 Tax=Rubrobacter aplysinae TaxID=909625 RepID=UPI00069DA7D2|nr:Lrp/AsnC family transcriptional regulator [Rubrobacter aplysinae]